jgi:hypothetical protein
MQTALHRSRADFERLGDLIDPPVPKEAEDDDCPVLVRQRSPPPETGPQDPDPTPVAPTPPPAPPGVASATTTWPSSTPPGRSSRPDCHMTRAIATAGRHGPWPHRPPRRPGQDPAATEREPAPDRPGSTGRSPRNDAGAPASRSSLAHAPLSILSLRAVGCPRPYTRLCPVEGSIGPASRYLRERATARTPAGCGPCPRDRPAPRLDPRPGRPGQATDEDPQLFSEKGGCLVLVKLDRTETKGSTRCVEDRLLGDSASTSPMGLRMTWSSTAARQLGTSLGKGTDLGRATRTKWLSQKPGPRSRVV